MWEDVHEKPGKQDELMKIQSVIAKLVTSNCEFLLFKENFKWQKIFILN